MPAWLASRLCLLGLLLSAGAVHLAGAAPLHWEPGNGFQSADLEVSASDRVGFTRLGPETTGLRFENPLPAGLAAANNNFMNGSGVAAGDFDSDGWCDLYFCAITGTNALYRNLGGWRFADVTARTGVGLTGLHSTGALFADCDGDGRLDLLVATLGTGVHCLLNQGDGQFREVTAGAGLVSDTGSTSLAMADVDGDGDLDLYVANYGALSILRSGGRAEMRQVNGQWVVTGPHAKRLRFIEGRLEEVGEPDVLYLNDGRGRFQAVPWNSAHFLDEEGNPKSEPWDFGLSVQMRDLNDDGAPDIYVCNDFQTVDRIWLNDGAGRFRALPRLALRKQSFSSMGVDFADLDRDGFLDFMATEMMSREHRLRMRQIVGMAPLVPVPGRVDNRPEIARNTLFHNRGDGTFAEIASYAGVPATDWSWQPVFLDVDLDGYEDLLIGNGMMFDVQDRDVLDRVRGLGRQAPEQARTNLLLYPPFLSPNLAFRNRRDLTFEDVSWAWGFDSTQITQGFAFADFDHDGDLDLAVNGINGGAGLHRFDSAAARVAVRLRGEPPNRAGFGARVRVLGGAVPMQMQEMRCGGHYLSGSDSQLVFAAGSPTNRLTLEVRWRSGRRSVLADAAPNRLYEIQEPPAPGGHSSVASNQLPVEAEPRTANKPPSTKHQAPGTADLTPHTSHQPLFRDISHRLRHTHHEELFNDFARQPLLTRLLSQLGPGVAWVDMDGDGRDELVVGAGRDGALGVSRQDHAGDFQPAVAAGLGPVPDDLAGLVAWPMAGGTNLLLTALASYETGATNGPAVIQWSFAPGRPPVATALTNVTLAGASPGPLAMADLDGQGNLALFVGGRVLPGAWPAPASSRLFRLSEDGWTLDATASRLLEKVGLVSGAQWTDLTGDGLPELVLACEWGPLRIFRNDRGSLSAWNPALTWPANLASLAPRSPPAPQPSTLSELTGWWSGVAAGDFDEDGRLDLIAGNWGWNDAAQASFDRPLRVYYGDLGGQGVVDVLEAYFPDELTTEMPRRNLNALSQALPFLRARYPTHAAFSTATVADVIALLPARPAVAAANTLATTLFLNRGDHFQAVPLPREAQWAPACAVCVADTDGDGHEDVFLSQNWFAFRPEWPRLDAGRGLWLRGDGRGNLTPMTGQESGVLVYGEQRGAAVGDFNADGRVDLAVSQNGTATCLYENIGARPGLRVRLTGPPANLAAIGSVLRLGAGGRLGPAREIRAGAGYWSQDSAVQVLAAAGEPDQLWVRWPGGREAVTPVPAGARELTVDFEGRVRVTPRREATRVAPMPE
jgi:hypothetical protein